MMREDKNPEVVSKRRGPGKHIWLSQPAVEFLNTQIPGGTRETWTATIEKLLCIGQVCPSCKADIPRGQGFAVKEKLVIKYYLCRECRDADEICGV